jgi:putative protease
MTFELLAPAKDLKTGTTAINFGADAVYIGAARFGAREDAGNPLADIAKLVEYAHRYWARVYVTFNTLLRDEEIPAALTSSVRSMKAVPTPSSSRTQGCSNATCRPSPFLPARRCNNHSPERVRFLEQVGFKRVILARELSWSRSTPSARKPLSSWKPSSTAPCASVTAGSAT